MTVNISYFAGAGWQFFDNNGVPLAGGLLYSYTAGTTTPAVTYTSSTGLIANTNPIVLDSAGRVNEVWLTTGSTYKFVLKTSAGVTLGTYDNIVGVNDVSSIAALLTAFEADLANTSNVAKGDALVGFRQSNSSGNLTGSVGKTVHQKFQEMVSVKDFGAVGDNSTNDTTAIQACATYCTNNGLSMYIPFGIYKITTAIAASCSIRGDGPMVSVIKNYGTGDALDLSGSVYYTTFENFSIDGSGNASSRDGISLYNTSTNTGNVAYCHFFNVYSYNNGRHGLYHRYAWATRYSQCKFHYNGRLGVFLNTVIPGDLGGPNGVTFFQCDSRHNGGSISGFGSDAGGIKVQGASVVSWIGGIIESNNGYGVYVGDAPGGASSRLVHFKQTYFEYNGYDVAIGALLYATGPWANIVVEDCWLAYGANTGNTNTLFYINASLDNGNFVEKNNTYIPLGAGTINKYAGTHFASPQLATGTAPTVFAYTNTTTTLSVPNVTFTKIIFDQEPWDTNQNFNIVTSRFTPTIAGYYRLSARVNGFPAAGTAFWISVYQNGAENFRGQQLNTANIGAVVDCLQYANGSTDYFEIYIYQDSGSTQSYTPGFNQCSLQIEYVRNT